MKEYLLTVATGALLVTLVNLLSPQGERGGTARFVRLFTSLLLICTIASPLSGVAQALEHLFQCDFSFGEESGLFTENDFKDPAFYMNESKTTANPFDFSDLYDDREDELKQQENSKRRSGISVVICVICALFCIWNNLSPGRFFNEVHILDCGVIPYVLLRNFQWFITDEK